MDERDIPNSWHIDLLRRFFPWSIHFKDMYLPYLVFNKVFYTDVSPYCFLHMFPLSDSDSAYNISKMTCQQRLTQIPDQTRWCSDASRNDPISDFSLHVHERPPSTSWVVGNASLVMPYSSHMHTAPTPHMTVNRLARAGDLATHHWSDGLYQI